MKTIKYPVRSKQTVYDPDTQANKEVGCFVVVERPCTEDAEEIAKAEAYNGEYTIEDDGQPEIYQPTIQEQLDAQAAAIVELMGVIYNG